MNLIESIVEDHINIAKLIDNNKIKQIVKLIIEIFVTRNKILIFGNGGSAADAQHVAAEFVNRFRIERSPLPAIALTTDTSIITSIGNDYSFDEIFSKQILAFGNEGDLAVGISTSGTSPNVIKALQTAKQNGLKTMLFCGEVFPKIPFNKVFSVPSQNTARIQEIHILVWHIICELIDRHYEATI